MMSAFAPTTASTERPAWSAVDMGGSDGVEPPPLWEGEHP
jgi:hypothetical protein